MKNIDNYLWVSLVFLNVILVVWYLEFILAQ